MSQYPGRRQSPAVYRRRRIVVFGALFLVIAGTVLITLQPWNAGGAPAPQPGQSSAPATASPGPTDAADGAATAESADDSAGGEGSEARPGEAEPTADADATGAVAEVVACGPYDIQVAAVTDKETYGADELPRLSLSLTNLTTVDCTIDVGTSVQSFVITSGNDTWWRSTDCQANPTTQIVTLAAGQTAVSEHPIVWDRTRSTVETCNDETRPRAGGGGSSYHLTVSLGSTQSVGTAHFMLY